MNNFKFEKQNNSEKGATALEYAVLAALILLAVIGIITTVGRTTGSTFSRINSGMANTNTPVLPN